jgi:hypothetical protein
MKINGQSITFMVISPPIKASYSAYATLVLGSSYMLRYIATVKMPNRSVKSKIITAVIAIWFIVSAISVFSVLAIAAEDGEQ